MMFRILVFFFFLLILHAGYSQSTYTSRANGTWESGARWNCSGPCGDAWPGQSGSNDNVVLASPYTISANNGTKDINNLTINNGGTLNQAPTSNFNTATINVGGNYSNSGTHSQTVGGFIRSSVINVTGTYTINATGNHTITGGGTITAATVNTTGTVTNSGVINQNASGVAASNLNAGGNFINNGTINHSSTATAQITCDGNFTNNSTINQGGTNGTSSITVLGNYSNTSSHTLTSNSASQEATLTISGATISGAATFSGSGQASSLTLNGAVQQTLGSVWSVSNMEINNSFGTIPQVIFSNNVTINNSLTLTDGVVQTSNTVIFTSAATSTGGSAGSYIDGLVQKTGNTNFIFPLGDGNIWARTEVSSISNADAVFRAQYFDGAYVDVFTMDPLSNPSIQSVSDIEYWTITENSGNNRTARVRLYWEDSIRSHIIDPADLSVAKFDVSLDPDAWTNDGTSYTTTLNGDNSGNIITTGNVSFSSGPITFGSIAGTALPITLIEFNAEIKHHHTLLSWSTSSEINNEFFTIERRTDFDTDFRIIGKVNGAGNSTTLQKYSYADTKPQTGKNYYRLKQTDFNGDFEYFDIIMVSFEESIEFSIFPNPSNGDFHINTYFGDLPADLTIFDHMGKWINSYNLNELDRDQTLKTDLNPGLYIFQAKIGDQTITKNIVIK